MNDQNSVAIAKRPPAETPENMEHRNSINSDHNGEVGNDSAGEDDVSGHENDQQERRKKRSRACQACRSMKIRCIPVDGEDQCSSCLKAKRACVMPGPPRKRQKTVHKVAELEKKINALTESLLAKAQGQSNPTPPHDSPVVDRSIENTSETTWTENGPPTMPQERTDAEAGLVLERGKMGLNTQNAGFNLAPSPEYIDVIDKGMVDMENALVTFDYFVNRMTPFFPAVVFPPGTTAQSLRKAKPMLFLSILACAGAPNNPAPQPELVTELNHQLAHRVLFNGEKSLDLVQAILIYSIYYVRPKTGTDLAFNQYIHAAIVMCFDLGFGKRSRGDAKRSPWEQAELRRTWLGCYFQAANVSTLLRNPSLVGNSPHVEDCLEFLSTSSYALESDKWVCCLVRAHLIAYSVSVTFSMDDPATAIAFTDPKTQYHLKAFEKQLDDWKKTVPEGINQNQVKHLYASQRLFMNEIALHQDHNVEDFVPFASSRRSGPAAAGFITAAHIEGLTICLRSSHDILDAYLACDLTTLRSFPNLFLVWSVYALVALIKIHGIVHGPDSQHVSVFAPDLKVEYYLEAMSQKIAQAADGGHWPPCEAFGFVIKKLKMWFTHKKIPEWSNMKPGDMVSPDDPEMKASGAGISTVNVVLNRIDEDNPSTNTRRGMERSQPTYVSGNSGETPRMNNGAPVRTGSVSGVGSYDQPRNGPFPFSPPNSNHQGMMNTVGSGMMSALPSMGPPSNYGIGTDLNAAYDASTYDGTNWDDIDFSVNEINAFDYFMNNTQGMGYFL